MINTALGMVIDPRTGKPRLGNGGGGLSGPAIHPIAVRAVFEVHRALPHLAIVGVGGVVDVDDALELMMAGASAVQVGTAHFAQPRTSVRLVAALDRFDFTLMEAAADLGASRRRAVWRIMLPLTAPGIAAGSVLVFIPTVGQFVVSDLLGGAKVDFLGNLLQRLFTRSNPPNWPLGSAMAVIFMVVLTVAIVAYFRATAEERR